MNKNVQTRKKMNCLAVASFLFCFVNYYAKLHSSLDCVRASDTLTHGKFYGRAVSADNFTV